MLPTPQAFDAVKGNGMGTDPEALERRLAQGGCSNLAEWAALGKLETFPTPTVNMVSGGPNDTAPTVNAGRHGINLKGFVRRFPTPTTKDTNDSGGKDNKIVGNKIQRAGGSTHSMSLAAQAIRGLLPTPKSRDWKGQSQRGIHAPGDALPNMDNGEGKPIGTKLNPNWVDRLMGMPHGWSDLAPLDMQEWEEWKAGFGGTPFAGVPHYGEHSWRDGTWEEGVPRLVEEDANRVGRLTGLGNAQVPACAAAAWWLLMEGDSPKEKDE